MGHGGMVIYEEPGHATSLTEGSGPMADRNGLQTTIGLVLAAGTSVMLWAGLVQAVRWAAHSIL